MVVGPLNWLDVFSDPVHTLNLDARQTCFKMKRSTRRTVHFDGGRARSGMRVPSAHRAGQRPGSKPIWSRIMANASRLAR